jgi:hypothetical protein|tara:strand:- start:2144 stop:2713 length:570 start_codon:yes stop_codon:yes gene_type:complete
MASIKNMTKVRVDNIFLNLVGIKNLNLINFKAVGKNFKETFESNVETSLNGITLFDKNSINYLNIELRDILSSLLKPYCNNFIFNVNGIWINKYKDKDYQGTHIHPSDFSFIIYYKINKSHTVFNSPVKNLLEMFNSKIFFKHYEPELKEGDIIVFPSYLEHWVKPNSNNITIAGNIKIMELLNDKNNK